MAQTFTADATQWQNADDKISELEGKTLGASTLFKSDVIVVPNTIIVSKEQVEVGDIITIKAKGIPVYSSDIRLFITGDIPSTVYTVKAGEETVLTIQVEDNFAYLMTQYTNIESMEIERFAKDSIKYAIENLYATKLDNGISVSNDASISARECAKCFKFLKIYKPEDADNIDSLEINIVNKQRKRIGIISKEGSQKYLIDMTGNYYISDDISLYFDWDSFDDVNNINTVNSGLGITEYAISDKHIIERLQILNDKNEELEGKISNLDSKINEVESGVKTLFEPSEYITGGIIVSKEQVSAYEVVHIVAKNASQYTSTIRLFIDNDVASTTYNLTDEFSEFDIQIPENFSSIKVLYAPANIKEVTTRPNASIRKSIEALNVRKLGNGITVRDYAPIVALDWSKAIKFIRLYNQNVIDQIGNLEINICSKSSKRIGIIQKSGSQVYLLDAQSNHYIDSNIEFYVDWDSAPDAVLNTRNSGLDLNEYAAYGNGVTKRIDKLYSLFPDTNDPSFKTVNGESIVGSGNIEVQGGEGAYKRPLEDKCVYILGDSVMQYQTAHEFYEQNFWLEDDNGNRYEYDSTGAFSGIKAVNGIAYLESTLVDGQPVDSSVKLHIVNDPATQQSADNADWEALKTKLKARELHNLGLGGSRFSEGYGTRLLITDRPTYGDKKGFQSNSMCNQVRWLISKVDAGEWSEPDLIVVYGGSNETTITQEPSGEYANYDYIMRRKYANIADDVKGYYTRQEIYGGLRYIIETLVRRFPYATIIFGTSAQSSRANRNSSDTANTTRGFNQMEVVNACVERICKRYSIQVFSAQREMGLTNFGELAMQGSDWASDEDMGTQVPIFTLPGDGLHPSEAGKTLFTNFFANRLEMMYFPKK